MLCKHSTELCGRIFSIKLPFDLFLATKVFFILVWISVTNVKGEEYEGLRLGKLNTYAHQVTGEVFAVDEYTILIKNFFYDGLGQDTFFWAGSTVRPSNIGFIVPDEEGKTNKLQRYVNEDVTLRLPEKRKITSIKWLAVWDLREHGPFGQEAVLLTAGLMNSFARSNELQLPFPHPSNFADIYIPEGLEPPSPQKISELSRTTHGVRSDAVVVIDSKTISILNLYYNGNETGVFFWVGIGPQPSSHGEKIPDESGYLNHLNPYYGEDVVLELPGKMTVDDIDWISIWNVEKKESYGYVIIPDKLNIPPSLITLIEHESPLPNCEQLHKDLQVSWEIFGPQITFHLSGQIDDKDYMALGISGSPTRSQMLDSDVAISYMNGLLGITADYNITGRYPCTNVLGKNKGVCLDEKVGGQGSYQIHTYVRSDGITSITYRRNLLNSDDSGDKVFNQEGFTYFVWAMGKYNKFFEPTFHHTFPRGDIKFELGRKPPQKNCFPFSRYKKAKPKPKHWGPLRIKDTLVTTFTVRVGMPGAYRGYYGMTGFSSPGVVWYVNGLMAPEIHVKRGRKYVFQVEGGNDPYNARFYHPLYITNDPHGGYSRYKEEEREGIKIYAGVEFDRRGRAHPSTAGRLCSWIYNTSTYYKADNFPTFPKFRNSLRLECKEGEPARLEWTPNASVPDLVYYQSYTQRDVGWKIFVVDEIIHSSASHGTPSLLKIVLCLLTFVVQVIVQKNV